MQKLYRQLFQTLQNGGEAVVVTRCGPSGVEKTLGVENAFFRDALYMEKQGEDVIVAERFLPKPRMIVLGGGHIAVPLCQMASLLQFGVTVFDDRPSFADKTRFPQADEVICESFDKIARRVTLRGSDYVVIVTRGHRHDQDCLRVVLKGERPCYVGMIGSKRRTAIVRQQMADDGYPPKLIQRLHSPIGLSIGAVTPEEIAVSILAEVIQEKRKNRVPEDAGQYGGIYADTELVERLAWAEAEGERAAVVTVLSTKGSTPREAGAKMALFADGRTVGSIGGGCAEADVARDARDVIRSGAYRFKTLDMTDSAEEDGMVCGGTMEVLIEALQ
jgi:xanthine dehydrogenase accessory factor